MWRNLFFTPNAIAVPFAGLFKLTEVRDDLRASFVFDRKLRVHDCGLLLQGCKETLAYFEVRVHSKECTSMANGVGLPTNN